MLINNPFQGPQVSKAQTNILVRIPENVICTCGTHAGTIFLKASILFVAVVLSRVVLAVRTFSTPWHLAVDPDKARTNPQLPVDAGTRSQGTPGLTVYRARSGQHVAYTGKPGKRKC